jgi:hypothetical protein
MIQNSTPSAPSSPTPSAGGSSALVWGAFAAFLVTRIYLVTLFIPWYSDVPLYFKYALDTHDFGHVPYLQEKIEYPPLAYEAMVLPRLFDGQRLSPALAKYVDWKVLYADYHRTFRIMMALAEGAGFVLFALTLARRHRELLGVGCWGYVLSTTLLAHVLHTRLDAGLLAILMFWAYTWTRSPGPEPRLSLWLAYFSVGLGISYKLVPIVIVPFLLLADWQAGRGWSRLRAPAIGLAYLGIGAFLPYVPLLKTSGGSLLNWLNFHAERGIEVESIYASLLMALAPLGLELEAFSGPGSWDVKSSLTGFLVPASTWFVALALAALGGVAWLRRANYGRDASFRFACLAMVLTVTFSKVLSPQYLVWYLPLVLLWGADTLSRREYVGLIIATVVVAGLSTAVFPYLFFGGVVKPSPDFVTSNQYCLVPDQHPLPVALAVLRNVILLGIVATMLRCTFTRGCQAGRTSAPAA